MKTVKFDIVSQLKTEDEIKLFVNVVQLDSAPDVIESAKQLAEEARAIIAQENKNT